MDASSKRANVDSSADEDNNEPEKNIGLDLEEVHEIPRHKNPFLFPPVLSVLFSYMNTKSLKQVRQVCHLWKDVAAPIFKEKSLGYMELVSSCNIDRDHRKESVEIVQKFMSVMEGGYKLPFDNLCINVMDMCCERRMSKMFWTYGSQLVTLELLFDSYRFRSEHLKLLLLYWCPNLKTLKLSNIPYDIVESRENIFAVKEFVRRKSYIPGGPVSQITELEITDHSEDLYIEPLFIFHLLKVTPYLSTLEINFKNEEALSNFLQGLGNARNVGLVQNLSSLIFGKEEICRLGEINLLYGRESSCNFCEHHLVSLLSIKGLLLKRLEILNVGEDISVITLRNLFLKSQHSLQVLRLGDSDKKQFPTKLLQIPRMTKLTHLEISCAEIQICEGLNVLKQFPNLRTCILEEEECDENEDCIWCKAVGCDCIDCNKTKWDSVTLKCSRQENAYSHNPLATIRFCYNPYCISHFNGIKKWFPSAKYVHANIVEDLFQYNEEDGFVTLDLIEAVRETNIEELHLEIINGKLARNTCCGEENVEEKEIDLKMLLERINEKITGVEMESETALNPFPELHTMSILLHGCHKININALRQLGIINLLETAPVLSKFTINNCCKTCSTIIYDQEGEKTPDTKDSLTGHETETQDFK